MRELIDFCKEHRMEISVAYSIELDAVYIRVSDQNTDDVRTLGMTTQEIQSIPGHMLENIIYDWIVEQFNMDKNQEDEDEEE